MTSFRAYTRTHVARFAGPITLDAKEDQPEPGTYTKPKGFWYEVNGDWRRWARGESYGLGEHLHVVTLGAERMLEIRTVEALDAFHATYAVNLGWRVRSEGIDWREIAKEYDGIEIAPYLWQRRLSDVDWYYTWDCASGVIWRPQGATVTYRRALRPRERELVREYA